jgi:outer membrane protein assembly factor BamB
MVYSMRKMRLISSNLYVLNPADGKIKDVYTSPKGWNSPTVANGILYYGMGADLYAVTLAKQQIVWHQDLSQSDSKVSLVENLQVENGVVYAQASTGPDELIVAFDARTGKKLWGPKTDAHILAITDTTVYTTAINLTSSAQLDAYDAHTGTLLWHQAINPSKTQTASDWHSIIKMLVDSDTLYVSYDSRSSAGGIAALNARDGTLLWQANVNDQEADSPLSIHDRVLYTVSNNGNNGAIDAFKTSDGSRLWHMALNGNATQWQADIA